LDLRPTPVARLCLEAEDASTWQGDRIALELTMLPDSEGNEPLELWCRRWIDAYLERVAVKRAPATSRSAT